MSPFSSGLVNRPDAVGGAAEIAEKRLLPCGLTDSGGAEEENGFFGGAVDVTGGRSFCANSPDGAAVGEEGPFVNIPARDEEDAAAAPKMDGTCPCASLLVSGLSLDRESCCVVLNTPEKGLCVLDSAFGNTLSPRDWPHSGFGATGVSLDWNRLDCPSPVWPASVGGAIPKSPGAAATGSSFLPNMFPPAAVAGGGLNTDSNGDEEDFGAEAAAAAVEVWKGLKGDAEGAEREGVEVEDVADEGIGGIPKRPPDDVENPDGGED